MVQPADDGTRGIVDPARGFEHFTLHRCRPRPELAWAVERYWVVRWDLRGEPAYEQRILRYPAVHLVFEAGVARIEAISREEFVRRLEGRGQVLGVKFRPAGFRPFLGRSVSTITGRQLPASTIFGDAVNRLAAQLAGSPDLTEMTGEVDAHLAGLDAAPVPGTHLVNDIVDGIAADRRLTRVNQLASRLQTTTRRLQRLFAEHVGLGPKWVINRYRLQEATDLVTTGEPVDWATTAAAMGYSDQSHLTRDFTAALGMPPGRYARRD